MPNGFRNGEKNGGRDSFWVSVLRLVTPAGVLAILAVAYSISSDLDRNCDATNAVSIVTVGLITTAAEVKPTEKRRLRQFLAANIPEC